MALNGPEAALAEASMRRGRAKSSFALGFPARVPWDWRDEMNCATVRVADEEQPRPHRHDRRYLGELCETPSTMWVNEGGEPREIDDVCGQECCEAEDVGLDVDGIPVAMCAECCEGQGS